MNNTLPLQIEFLQKIISQIKSGTLPANEIARLLKISNSEAYNKMSGKSALTLAQVQVLCKKYDVDFEISSRASGNIRARVSYTPFHTGKISVGNYLALLNKFISSLKAQNVKKLSCATDDIPFFHLFKYPELTAFKLYFWQSRIPGKKTLKVSDEPFDFKKSNKTNIKSAFKLHKAYQSIPSLEIWTKSQLLVSIDQIKLAYESQLLKDKSLARAVCDQLLLTLDDVEQYAIVGNKESTTGTFDWYQCDVVGNVAYLAETQKNNISFLRFNTFNNLTSADAGLGKEVKMWLQFLLNNATGFTGHGTKQRNSYLQKARNTISGLKEKF
ncbi:MAG: hypothetical protein JSS98_12895 [Bacteroidetes bacterium]|nr:hypothetical protein [Bacteroidota bacterium]